ncbi:MAG: phosphodiester glycosidase family protein [Deltaproteobacteria bacterium]|nr:phosphodiester glycosidase family protein [Deltaproteobacteria bacterium]
MPAWLYRVILICWVCLLAPVTVRGAGLTHTSPRWQTLGRGLSFTQVDVLREGEVNEVMATLAVVKIDPASNAFRVFHHAPQAITLWQQELKAPIVFNASYYGTDNQPVGLIIADGQAIGSGRNRQMRGMFVAEPKGISPDLPRATILDLLATPINPKNLPWTQGVQSFPLLLDYKGNIRVRDSEKKANRTVIATDRVGNILIFNTSNRYFTLRELAQFLKASKFDVDSALNLDGGTEAQLLIKTKDFEFFSPPTWEHSIGNLLDQSPYWLPTVVGVFPRQE